MPIHKFLFRNCGGSALHLSDDMQLFGISGSYFCGKVKVVCMVCWGLLLAFWKSFYSFACTLRGVKNARLHAFSEIFGIKVSENKT